MKHNNIVFIYLFSLFIFLSCSHSLSLRNFSSDKNSVEIYRPSILEVVSEDIDISRDWESYLVSICEYVSMILGFYHDHEIYFLSRDAELYYDLATLISHNFSDVPKKNIKLLHVSSKSVKDENYDKYLYHKGIRKKKLNDGAKVLLVDTGFSGTIPAHTQKHFLDSSRENIRSQFILSKNKLIPSSRTSLMWLVKEAYHLPDVAYDRIYSFEELKHVHYSIETYRKDREKSRNWVPYVHKVKEDGIKITAINFMKSLKKYFENADVQKIIRERIGFWKNLRGMVGKTKVDELKKYLNNIKNFKQKLSWPAMRSFHFISPQIFKEAVIRDLREMVETNFLHDFKMNNILSFLYSFYQDSERYKYIASLKDNLSIYYWIKHPEIEIDWHIKNSHPRLIINFYETHYKKFPQDNKLLERVLKEFPLHKTSIELYDYIFSEMGFNDHAIKMMMEFFQHKHSYKFGYLLEKLLKLVKKGKIEFPVLYEQIFFYSHSVHWVHYLGEIIIMRGCSEVIEGILRWTQWNFAKYDFFKEACQKTSTVEREKVIGQGLEKLKSL